FHFARCAFVLDNAPRSCPQNGVTSYATFVCRPGFTYRAFIIACSGFCAVLRSDQRLPRHCKRSSNVYLHSRNAIAACGRDGGGIYLFWGPPGRTERCVCHCAYAANESAA